MTDQPKIVSNFKDNIGVSLGINESMIKDMVDSFYAKVRNDQLIGPIFEEKIQNNWEAHLTIMYDFWSSVVLSTARYQGTPMMKHISLPGLNKEHFVRWLSIFEENANYIFSKEIAEFFINKATRIAESLMFGIACSRGKLEL